MNVSLFECVLGFFICFSQIPRDDVCVAELYVKYKQCLGSALLRLEQLLLNYYILNIYNSQSRIFFCLFFFNAL